MSPSPSPRPSDAARGLGYLATVPFLAGAVLVTVVGPEWRPMVSRALSDYAAVVVAFIGAIHWGLAFAQPDSAGRPFLWGVVPSLVAWFALWLQPANGLIVHAVMLVVCYGVDRATYPAYGVARWLPLRLNLTVVATICCLVGAAVR